MMPAASAQKRIDRTMFFPTPNFTMASSSLAEVKISGHQETSFAAFGNQAYRQGNVSWPENLYINFWLMTV
jgi:hypothetical protein